MAVLVCQNAKFGAVGAHQLDAQEGHLTAKLGWRRIRLDPNYAVAFYNRCDAHPLGALSDRIDRKRTLGLGFVT